MEIKQSETLDELTMLTPEWIIDGGEFTGSDIESIQYGGCASGAYMPAVTYHRARETMSEHGDAVLEYIEECCGELPKPPANSSWSGMACFYLSTAVELWAAQFEVIEDESEVA